MKNNEAIKKEETLKYMNFNRYLIVRYFIAGYIFMNFFWGIVNFSYSGLLALLPFILMILGIVASVELSSKLSHKENNRVPITLLYFYLQAFTNVVLAIISFTGIGKLVFPFIYANNAKSIILAILLIGLILALKSISNLYRIQENSDRYYSVIQKFKETSK